MKNLTASIKNTAVNGKNARTVIQRHDLAPFGFDCHARFDIEWNYAKQMITLKAKPAGERKVSCVVDKRRGVTYQTIDYRWNVDARFVTFGKAERLDVTISKNRITLKAAK
jgi:hypothetical protein